VSENWKPQEGQVVEGKFRLLQLLGGTDHSAVFLTERADEPKKAVIKLIPAANAENQILHWKLDTKLPHPHLLRIFESGKCELNGHQLLYVVMEYAEEDLSQILPHRPLTAAEAREMVLPVLDALSYLHRKGFVHGGLKPANVLAIADQVKLSSDSICAISEGVGTPSIYDPPEAKIGKISVATDVWALGMMLTEVLTLQRPAWDAIKRQEPILPKELDESFRIVIRNCLRLDASSRWTITEIKSLLQPDKAPAVKVIRGRRSSVWFYVIPIVVLLVFGYIFNRMNHSKVPTNSQINILITESEKPSPTASRPQAKIASPQVDAPSPKPTAITPAPTATPKIKSATPQTSSSVVQQVLPGVPASASRTITGRIRIRVKVSVDAAGNVTDATLDSPSKSNYFNHLAQQAAEKWKFAPAASQWIIHFVFTSSKNDAVAEQVKQ
jgi:TonB family protein